jgi:hypothetical protein
MPISPVQLTVTVTTAGTRVRPYSDTTVLPQSVYFEADGANTGYVYIGVSTVSSTAYIARLSAGQAISFSSDNTGTSGVTKDAVAYQLSDFYIDASANGQKVQVTYGKVVT